MNISDEIYVSVDIEADGPIPGPHSMLSFGAAAFGPDSGLTSTFTRNLVCLEDAAPDPRTSEFWRNNPEAYQATRTDTRAPSVAMPEFVRWVKGLPARPVFVAYPAGFDFLFMYWYMIRFAGESPFSFSALDIKTYAMALLGTPYRASAKRNMPKHWRPRRRHTHIALDDAIEQGELFLNMLKERDATVDVVDGGTPSS